MRVEKIIPYSYWLHESGRTASIRGAVPWTSETERCQWIRVTKGYTWVMSNGTTGLGRCPAATYKEALEVMTRINGGF